MIVPNQLALIETALREIWPCSQPADVALSTFFRARPKLGSQDRQLVAETVYTALRRKRTLEYLWPDAGPRSLVLATLIKIRGLSLRDVEDALRPGERERLVELKAKSAQDAPLAVRLDWPDWLLERLEGTMPDAELLSLGQSLLHPAPLDLRVNTLKISREQALAQLQAQGIEAQATPYSPFGIRVKGKPYLQKNPLFQGGALEVQDEGSQLLGLLLAPRRGEMVVDFCAGAGGKTLLLGQLMNSQGRLYAFDVSEKRLNNLKPRLKRSGLSNVMPQLIDHERDIKIKRLAGKIDRVLVDAPCSGLGTLRRNPDLKWRQSPQSVAELLVKQRAILDSAARLVKQGGRLVYATCSLLPEENEQMVRGFLVDHPEFSVVPAGEVLAQAQVSLPMGEWLQLRPDTHQTDGFFAAVLRRGAGAPPVAPAHGAVDDSVDESVAGESTSG